METIRRAWSAWSSISRPFFDQGMSAHLQDLHERGLLESTLVIATGEFGRSPSISRLGGRDHWPFCFRRWLPGVVCRAGASWEPATSRAAYPFDRPISPADFAATLFRLLGVECEFRRPSPPFRISKGIPSGMVRLKFREAVTGRSTHVICGLTDDDSQPSLSSPLFRRFTWCAIVAIGLVAVPATSRKRRWPITDW